MLKYLPVILVSIPSILFDDKSTFPFEICSKDALSSFTSSFNGFFKANAFASSTRALHFHLKEEEKSCDKNC